MISATMLVEIVAQFIGERRLVDILIIGSRPIK